MIEYRQYFTKSELMTINRCRLYLRVLFLSDITDGAEKNVTSKAMNGIDDSFRKSRWIWPLQIRPTAPEWKIWQKGIGILATGREQRSRTLSSPLGPWTKQSHQQLQWYFCKSEGTVYRKLRVGWRRYDKTTNERTHMDGCRYKKGRRVFSAPVDVLSTCIQLGPNANNIWIDGY